MKLASKILNDPTLTIDGGRVFVQHRNEDGELLWIKSDGVISPMMKDVTPVAVSAETLPTPLKGERFYTDKELEEAASTQALTRVADRFLQIVGINEAPMTDKPGRY